MKKIEANLRCRILMVLLLSVAFVTVTGCGDEDGPTGNEVQGDPVDVTGSWEMTRTVTSNTCGLTDGTSNTETILLAADGDYITVTNFGGVWGSATVDGDEVTIQGSEISSHLGCLATLTTTGTAIVDSDEMAGTLTTSVEFDSDDCGEQPPEHASQRAERRQVGVVGKCLRMLEADHLDEVLGLVGAAVPVAADGQCAECQRREEAEPSHRCHT